VIEEREPAGDGAGVAAVGLVGCVERADAPVGAPDRGVRAGTHRRTLRDGPGHLLGAALEVVRIVDRDARRPENRLVAPRDDDVAVGGWPTPVQHGVDAGILDGDHHATRRLHGDGNARERGTLPCPRPGGVDHGVGLHRRVEAPAHVDAESAAFDVNVLDGRLGMKRRTRLPGGVGVRDDQPRRRDDGVGDGESALDGRARRGHALAEFVARERLDGHPQSLAGRALALEVGRIVAVELEEVAARLPDAGARDVTEDAVLGEAGGGVVGVGVGVPGAAVEDAV